MLVRNHFTHDARVYREARTLVDAGWRVLVLARPAEGLEAREENEGIDVHRPDAWLPGLGRRPARSTASERDSRVSGVEHGEKSVRRGSAIQRMVWKLRWEIAFLLAATEARAGVYHAHELNTLLTAFLAARRRRAKLIYDAHELQVEVPEGRGVSVSGWVRVGRRLLERLLIIRADGVIDTSPARARILVRRYRIAPPVLILNAPPRRDRGPGIDLHESFGIAAQRKIAVYQGDLTPGKGIERVIETWSQVDDAALVVLGDGPIRGELESLTEELGIADRVHFAGRIPRSELLDYSAGADLGLCLMDRSNLSHYTSLPNKLFEFMAVGVPIIAYESPEIGRVIRETGAGLTVESNEPGAVAAAIERLLDDPAHLETLGSEGWQAAQSLYSWERQAERLLALYGALVPPPIGSARSAKERGG